MKLHRMENSRKISFLAAASIIACIVLMLTGPAMAADNQGTGDVAGDSASLSSSNIFSLFSTTMALNKMAFLANGTQLTSGATLPRGTKVRFVIYIDNTTLFPLEDVSIQDVLDPAFAYSTGSMKVDNTLSSGAAQAEIYSTVYNSGTSVSDVAGDDVASLTGATIDVGNSVVGTNSQLDVAQDSVWAIVFSVLMQ